MGYLTNSGSGFLSNAVTTVSNVKSYLVNKTGYLVDAIRVGIGDFGQRVLDDGGTVEASAEAAASYRDITKDIYDQASLVLFPSGYKESKVYSHKPVDGSGDFTYTRGTDTATRVGADGYIKKERVNFLEQSNQFDTTWNLSGGSTLNQNAVGINNIPNTAWTFTKDSTFDGIKQNISLSGINTFSVYAKKIDSSVNELVLRINVAGGNRIAIFDLSNGTKVSMTSHSSAVHYDIQKAGNGWYRCSFVVAGTIANVDIRMDYNQTGTGSMLVQNAQLEQGLVATPYIETTTAPVYEGLTDSMPRIDYTGGTPSILLEPSRINLIEQSEYFNGSDWSRNNTSVIDNAIISPEGLLNGSKFIQDNGTTDCNVRTQDTINVVSGDIYTFSVFAKKAEFDKIQLDFSDSRFGAAYVIADLTNGTLTAGEDNTDEGIEDYGNGWYRVYVVGTAIATGTAARIFRLNDNGSGDGSKGIYAYGAQIEQGSYPTSYIPTYNSSATRAADDINKLTNLSTNGIANNYSTTLFFEGTNFKTTANTRFATLYDSSSSSNPRVLLYSTNFNSSTFRINLQYRSTGQSDVSLGTGSMTYNTRFKGIVRLDGTSLSLFVNGTEYSTTIVQADDIEVLDLADILNDLSHTISKLSVFPTALSDDDCEALTAL